MVNQLFPWPFSIVMFNLSMGKGDFPSRSSDFNGAFHGMKSGTWMALFNGDLACQIPR